MSNLQKILENLENPNPFPSILPFIHVSKGGNDIFRNIIENGQLSPRQCKVFPTHNLLYFSYGNVFYHTGNDPTWKETYLPVCFLFKPSTLLSQITYYFPYDTGAAKFGRYKEHSEYLSNNFDKYRVNGYYENTAQKLVYYLYQSNHNYRKGKIHPSPEPRLIGAFPSLFEFFNAKIEKCDKRQFTIECQTTQNITLGGNLEWIAYPEDQENWTLSFRDLFYQIQPEPPTRYCYEWTTNFDPREIIGKIQEKASEFIKNKYLEP